MTRAETVRFLEDYIEAVSGFATGEALARFYDPDVIFREHPNALSPHGATRDLAGILKSAQAGASILSAQRMRILEAVIEGDRAAVRLSWEGDLQIAFRTLKPGDTMRAAFAQFYRFKDGRIVAQETFDCIDLP